jgi:hypothetical protein
MPVFHWELFSREDVRSTRNGSEASGVPLPKETEKFGEISSGLNALLWEVNHAESTQSICFAQLDDFRFVTHLASRVAPYPTTGGFASVQKRRRAIDVNGRLDQIRKKTTRLLGICSESS